MTGTKALTLKQLADQYRAEGAIGVGSHYVIDRDGDVHKGRPIDEHANVHPKFNGDSVFIEVMCSKASQITEGQHAAIRGAIDVILDTYPNAQELDLTL